MIRDYFNKLNYFAIILTLSLGLFISSCSEDDNPTNNNTINESKILAEYLEANGDFINTAAPAMIKSTDVNTMILTSPDNIYVIDIRSDVDYAAGHIPGAVNVTLGNLVSHVESIDASSYEKIAIACYTGQTASFGASLLRLLGYDNVVAMKWGMCSWHTDFKGKWDSNISNARATQFESTSYPKAAAGNYPVFNTGKSTGSEILKARVNQVLADGFAKVTNAEVFDNLSTYYIVNYWKESHYTDPGHIPGAMQYTPKADLKTTTYLNTLPTDKPVVIYCYTGQTSAFMTAYLRVLGYDAKSLLFGTNAMIYDVMTGIEGMTYWSESQTHDYDYEM
jgi:rhodanese-related sulfurtransferase